MQGTHLLMAVGRKPNIDALDLNKGGNCPHRQGHHRRREPAHLRPQGFYAIGDVAGGMQFTHVAGYHAGLIIRQALFGLPAKEMTAHIPWATYTDPEIAQVGLTEEQARADPWRQGWRWRVLNTPTMTAP